MSDQRVRNVLKVIAAFIVYYSGIFFLLNKLIKRNGLLIFNYHNFSTFTNDYWRNGSLYQLSYRENFEKQVTFIKRTLGFVSTELIEVQLEKRGLKVILTFDDGYKDNFEIAFPILMKHNASAIFFVATDFIGNNTLLWHDSARLWGIKNGYPKKYIKVTLRKLIDGEIDIRKYIQHKELNSSFKAPLMMKWHHVSKIAESGFKIGAHSKSHIPFTHLTQSEEIQEVSGSINVLKQKLSLNVEFFAVPNGKYSPHTEKILAQSGIKYCFSVMSGVNDASTNMHLLKRNPLLPSDPVPVVALKILMIRLFA